MRAHYEGWTISELEAEIRRRGYKLRYDHPWAMGNRYGSTNWFSKNVQIRDNQHPVVLRATLAHELTHIDGHGLVEQTEEEKEVGKFLGHEDYRCGTYSIPEDVRPIIMELVSWRAAHPEGDGNAILRELKVKYKYLSSRYNILWDE